MSFQELGSSIGKVVDETDIGKAIIGKAIELDEFLKAEEKAQAAGAGWWWTTRLLALLLTCQLVAATTIFFKLSGYNNKHKKRFEEARACASKPSNSLFELPAFRGKTEKSVPSPFENTTWLLTLYEQVKLSVVAVTVFPLRFIGMVVAFLGACLACYILESMRLRRAARLVVHIAGRFVLFCFGFIYISVKGELAEGVGVLVSNHSTFLDGLVWVTFSTPRIFAEKANFVHPVMQVFAKTLDIVLFDRSGSESRRQARMIMEKSAQEAFDGNASPILVFPTGTTTNSQVLITFKDGAFAPGLPVQPAVLRYKFRHCDPCWVFSGPGTLNLLFRIMSQFYNTLDIEFLPVHNPSEEERKDPHKFARAVQLELAESMGVPVTQHSVEDLQLQFAAVKANLPAEVGVVGFAGLKDVFSVDANQIKQQLHVFKEMDKDRSGLVGFEEFKAAFTRGFHEPSEEQTEFLKVFFDQLTGGESNLDFRKFLIGLALVNENEKAKNGPKREQSPTRPGDSNGSKRSSTTFPLLEIRGKVYTQLAFAAFAAESDDRISWNEFKELWNWLHPAGVSSEVLEELNRTSSDLSPGGAGGASPRKGWGSFSGMFRRRSRTESQTSSLLESDVNTLARAVFDQIAGEHAQMCKWDQFSAYSEQNPIFVTELRQAFFGRIAKDFSTQ